MLLQRFPRLVKLNQKTLAKKIKIVMVACALHNICILEKDNVDYYLARAIHVGANDITNITAIDITLV